MAAPGDALDRHYVRGQQVTVTEDLTHEFKGHRSISVYDLPRPRSRDSTGQLQSTRNAVSASVGGMLNTGLGGTVYLGVSDDGRVVGLPLTVQQQQHVTASLAWTMDRFTPPVTPHRYHVTFTPVLPPHPPASSHRPSEEGGGAGGGGEGSGAPHHVATPNRCWCDEEARRQVAVPQVYVVEIHLHPWDPSMQGEGNAAPDPPLPPLHLTEANVCYYRHGSRQVTLCLDAARRLLVHRTQRHYTLRLASLREQRATLHCLATERGLLGEGQGQGGAGEGGQGKGGAGEGELEGEERRKMLK